MNPLGPVHWVLSGDQTTLCGMQRGTVRAARRDVDLVECAKCRAELPVPNTAQHRKLALEAEEMLDWGSAAHHWFAAIRAYPEGLFPSRLAVLDILNMWGKAEMCAQAHWGVMIRARQRGALTRPGVAQEVAFVLAESQDAPYSPRVVETAREIIEKAAA